jgi:hypothetical protein
LDYVKGGGKAAFLHFLTLALWLLRCGTHREGH